MSSIRCQQHSTYTKIICASIVNAVDIRLLDSILIRLWMSRQHFLKMPCSPFQIFFVGQAYLRVAICLPQVSLFLSWDEATPDHSPQSAFAAFCDQSPLSRSVNSSLARLSFAHTYVSHVAMFSIVVISGDMRIWT
jgi:hypothetical protein